MKVEVGDILVCKKREGNFIVLEVSDYVYLLKAEKLYVPEAERSVSDYWRVSEGYFNDNFMML